MEFRREAFRRIESLHGQKKSLSSTPFEKYSTNTILAPQTPFIQKEIPNPPEVWDSYISTATNSEMSSASCLFPTDEPSSQAQATLNTDKVQDQLSIPTPSTSQQISDQITARPDFVSIPELDKNSKLELQHPDLNLSNILEYLKSHEQKCNFLQQQMSRILEQKTVPCYSNSKTDLVPANDFGLSNGILVSSQTSLDDNKIGALGGDTENSKLLACLQAQREKSLKLEVLNQTLQEKVQELQEENRKLQDRNNELINFLLKANGSPFNKIDNVHSPKSLDTDPIFNNVAGSVSLEERNKHSTNNIAIQQETVARNKSSSTKTSSSDVGNIEIRQEKEIEKTSTSTMTSVVYDGSDKVVYKKLTTVTTDFKKQCNELSAQCSVNKEALVTPPHRPSPKCTTSSSRRKQLKCRKCGKCSPHYSNGKSKPAHDVSADALENECGKNVRASSPRGNETVRGVTENAGKMNDVHNTEPKRIISPRYEKILKNVNELVLNFEDDEPVSRVEPILKPKGWKRNSPSSRAVDSTPMARKSENRQYSHQSQSSNSSSESVTTSPENSVQEAALKEQELSDNITGSTTISLYGLSSPNLSKSTRQYLDNFGLVRDNSKTSKSRTTLAKRYLR